MHINRWRNFTESTPFYRTLTTTTSESILSLLCYAPSHMFNVEVYWNVDSAFYLILHESVSNSDGFAVL